MRASGPASALLVLPQGLGVSGVATWAIRLVNVLARRGRACGLLAHPEPPGVAPVGFTIDPRVAVFRLGDAPPIGSTEGDLTPFVPGYRGAVEEMRRRAEGPVVLSPNLHGDCYGMAAELCRESPGMVRVVGWQHSDIEYDARVLMHYEPVIAKFVAVSDRIGSRLRDRLRDRAGDVRCIPYGVEVPEACTGRSPLRIGVRRRPVRLVYSGRIEREQKRVLALASLSRELSARGVAHELTIVGSGPADAELEGAVRGLPCVRRVGPASPAEVVRLLDAADAFVLASRYEGLSVSMLEAMARGCVPIVTRVDSGLMQAVEPGVSGVVAEVAADADEDAAGSALADAIERFLEADTGVMARAAWSAVRERFSLERHVDRVAGLIDEVAASPPRSWPKDRPAAFTAAGEGGSGSVPAEGAGRLRELLARLAGRRVVIHGTGRHTLQLREAILSSPAVIVGFCDDDPARQGSTLWGRAVVAPSAAGGLEATDVVISSWMHQEAVWRRRLVYERQGMAVWRVYPGEGGSG
jgi:glycosyltransferase involved in cell wall biosynthesis